MIPRTSMARYETYQSNAAEAPIMRKWIVRALILSLVLHAALFITFNLKKLENFGATDAPVLAPVPINMKRTVIPMIDDKPERVDLSKVPNVAKIQLPSEKPEVTEVRVAPQMSELTKPLPTEKPKVDTTGWDALAKAEQASRGQMDKELNSLAGSLIKESVRSPRQPMIKLPGGDKPGDSGAGTAEGIPGLQSIGDLLDKAGGIKAGDRGGIPGGALYEHDSADLKPAAITALQKLGELIKRNPSATFVIEGHTDATGSDEYNLDLSKRRAESVKDWLVQNMKIAPERIETVGFGSKKLIVSGDKSIEEQQPNRRVEIVIKTNRK
jgi:flagellar motor protein MotB